METTFINIDAVCRMAGMERKALRRITNKLGIKVVDFGQTSKFLRKDIVKNLHLIQAEYLNRAKPIKVGPRLPY